MSELFLRIGADPEGLAQVERATAALNAALSGAGLKGGVLGGELQGQVATLQREINALNIQVDKLKTAHLSLNSSTKASSASLSALAMGGKATAEALKATEASAIAADAAVQKVTAVQRAGWRATQAYTSSLDLRNKAFRESVGLQAKLKSAEDSTLRSLQQENLWLKNVAAARGLCTRAEVEAFAVKRGLASAYKSVGAPTLSWFEDPKVFAKGRQSLQAGTMVGVLSEQKKFESDWLAIQRFAKAQALETERWYAQGRKNLQAGTMVGVLSEQKKFESDWLAIQRFAKAQALETERWYARGRKNLQAGMLVSALREQKKFESDWLAIQRWAARQSSVKPAVPPAVQPQVPGAFLTDATGRSLLRGAAGAGGSLWMSYIKDFQQLLPLMGAFLTVSTAIKGIKYAAEFEYAARVTHEVAVSTGDYSMSLDTLREKLLGVSDTVHSVTELGTATKELVKAGFTQAEAVNEIGTMSKMASIAEEELAVITKTVAAQYRAWNVEAIGAERGVSSLTETANIMAYTAMASAVDIGELAEMMKHTSGLAIMSGASFSELNAALGYMSNLGIRGSTAATALNTAIMKLQNPTMAASKALVRLHASFSAFDEFGRQKGLTRLFTDLDTALKTLSTKERVQALEEIFSLRSMKGGVAMSQAVKDGAISFKMLEEGARRAGQELNYVDALFAGISDTTKKQFEMLKSDVYRELVKAFDSPTVKDFVKELRGLVNDGTITEIFKGISFILQATLQLVEAAIKYRDAMREVANYTPYGQAVKAIGKTAEFYAGLPAINRLQQLQMSRLTNKQSAFPLGTIPARGQLNFPGIAAPGADRWWETPEEPAYKFGTERPLYTPEEQRRAGIFAAEEAVREQDAANKRMEFLQSQANARALSTLQAFNSAKLLSEQGFLDASTTIKLQELRNKEAALDAEAALNKLKYDEAMQDASLQGDQSLLKEAQLKAAHDLEWANRFVAVKQDALQKEAATVRLNAEQESLTISAKLKEAAWNRETTILRGQLDARLISEEQFYRQSDALARKPLEGTRARLQDLISSGTLDPETTRAAQGALALLNIELDHLGDTQQLAQAARLTKVADHLRNLQQAADDAQNAVSLIEQTAGMGTAEGELFRRQNEISRTAQQEILKLEVEQVDGYERMIANRQKYADIMLGIAEEEYNARLALEHDWQAGVSTALKDYASDLENVHDSAGSYVAKTFKTMEDALVEFVTTGKFSFKDMITSMIADLIRFQVQQHVMLPLARSASGGDWAGAIGGFIGGLFSAKGNVFNDISGYANQVVQSPVAFRHGGLRAFAAGGGVMGEDGPEAVMPLVRTRTGNLGVAAVGAGISQPQNVKVVMVNESGNKLKTRDAQVSFNPQEMIVTLWLDALELDKFGLRKAIGR